MSRHRAGEPITSDEARQETAEKMADADRRRGRDTPDETLRLPGYVAQPTDVPVPAVVAEAGDNAAERNDDTTPPVNRQAAAAELTQPVVAIGGNLLATAANLLRHRGRCREVLIDEAGCLCPIGALAVAAGVPPTWDGFAEPCYHTVNKLPETAHLITLIRERAPAARHERRGPSTHDIWWWADRELDDDAVLALLDQAADSYQAVPA